MKSATPMFLIAIIGSLLGCESSQEEICSERFPEFIAQFEVVQAKLPHQESDRAIAMIPENFEDQEELVEFYQDWAESSLKTVQSFQDFTETNPAWLLYHRDLSKIANELVMFYAFSQDLKQSKMRESLRGLSERIQRVREGICREMSSTRTPGEAPQSTSMEKSKIISDSRFGASLRSR